MNEVITKEQTDALNLVGQVLPGVPETFRHILFLNERIQSFEDVENYLLRRTAGTLLDKAGVSLVAIRRFLRHENVSTTAKHYVINQELVGGQLAAVIL